jgi:glycerol-1-phosphate dehydrogenase [NAD(P)+]
VARSTIFGEDPLVAGAESVLRLLADLGDDESLLIAAGSGTITDIVRFVAAKTGRPFVSLPSAPSVDAWASSVAALVLDGSKVTLPARPPLAIFADPGILAGAPAPMIAAGFGDMVCKLTAVADWRLGAVVWDEPYDADLARRSLDAARRTVEAVEAIGARSAEGVRILMEALVESGLVMAAAGHSRSASGAEHHYSHFWEEAFLRTGRPPLLHGLKVGVGTVMSAGLWNRVRALSGSEAALLLESSRPPRRDSEVEAIRDLFGTRAEGILRAQERFLGLGGEAWSLLVARLISNWDTIAEIAEGVPEAASIAALLARAGCPTTPSGLGLEEGEVREALSGAHWLRDRFTVAKLARLLFPDL